MGYTIGSKRFKEIFMKKPADTMTPFEFDTRMVEWNLKHDVISKENLEKYLKTLVDDSDNTELLHIEDGSENSAN